MDDGGASDADGERHDEPRFWGTHGHTLDTKGRVIVDTTSLERAELKREISGTRVGIDLGAVSLSQGTICPMGRGSASESSKNRIRISSLVASGPHVPHVPKLDRLRRGC